MFSVNSYATIWASENKGKYPLVELSTRKKNKETNEYETDFAHKFVRFVGRAHNQASGLKNRDRIKITNCGVTTSKSNDKWYTNFLVFDFENADGGSTSNKASYDPYDGEFNEDDLPV